MQIIVKTLAGLESVLAEELEQIGAANIRPLKRAVSCEGDLSLLYRANYELRTALRVLQSLHTLRARDERDLYEAMRSIDWSNYMTLSDTFAIDAITQGEIFRHSKYAALVTKDAIVDQFRDKTGRRPNVNPEAPHVRIHVHISGSLCELSLDSSGDSLHRRNYRRDTVDAPLNEVLAAGMIALSGWNGTAPFADPMCGSGTLVIEAAMMALQRSPQYLREQFGFFKWRSFDSKLWSKVKAEADSRMLTTLPVPVVAADKDMRARNATSINLMACGLEQQVTVGKAAFEKWVPPVAPGVLMTNPPYDERLQIEDAAAFYKDMGDRQTTVDRLGCVGHFGQSRST